MKSSMYKSVSTGVTTPIFKVPIENNSAVNYLLNIGVISKDSVGNKCSAGGGVVNHVHVLRNSVFSTVTATVNYQENETDGNTTLTISTAYASNYVTVSVNVTQATFTPTSIVVYFNIISLCPGTVVIL